MSQVHWNAGDESRSDRRPAAADATSDRILMTFSS